MTSRRFGTISAVAFVSCGAGWASADSDASTAAPLEMEPGLPHAANSSGSGCGAILVAQLGPHSAFSHSWSAHCWQGGFTEELCCRQDAVVNCWDGVYTYRRCCPDAVEGAQRRSSSPSPAPTLPTTGPSFSAAPLAAESGGGDEALRSTPPQPVLEASAAAAIQVIDASEEVALRSTPPPPGLEASAAAAIQVMDASEDLALRSTPPPPAAAMQVMDASEDVALGSQLLTATAHAITTSSMGDVSCWHGGFSYSRCCTVPEVVSRLDGCWDAAFTEIRCCGTTQKTPGIAAEAPRAAETASPRTPASLADQTPELPSVAEEDETLGLSDDTQVGFLQREGTRRWAKYFRHAHSLLDEALASVAQPADIVADPKAASSSSAVNAPVGELAVRSTTLVREAAAKMDAVQLYHLLFEVVNQIVAGLQLASDSPGNALGGGQESQARSDASRRSAFLSASLVLARLDEASRNTPLEQEDFGSQASAAMALSCRSDSVAAFREDMKHRGMWLEREVLSAKTADSIAATSSVEQPLAAGGDGLARDASPAGAPLLLERIRRRLNRTNAWPDAAEAVFQRSWQMYTEDIAEAVWRPVEITSLGSQDPLFSRSTRNPLEERFANEADGKAHLWSLFPTYILSKSLRGIFSSKQGAHDRRTTRCRSSVGPPQEVVACTGCDELSAIVLRKYSEFEEMLHEGRHPDPESQRVRSPKGRRSLVMRPEEVNNAFFGWQLTHDVEQQERGAEVWPELYSDSVAFAELKRHAKLTCVEYLRRVYDASLVFEDVERDLELSMWASVVQPSSQGVSPGFEAPMGLAFHDHPLALLSGVFYAQAGGCGTGERTPTAFADPRGTASFRYTGRSGSGEKGRSTTGEDLDGGRTVEPIAPFHRLAYAHATDGLTLVFPPWLVHGVPAHQGRTPRVVFAFNLHTMHGTTLAAWAKTTL